MKTTQTICYVASASGGHIIPCLTLAQEQRQKNNEPRILFFSGNSPLDKEIIANAPWINTHVSLPITKGPYNNFFKLITLCYRLFIAMLKLFYYLMTQRPTRMVCTGGLISIPATICARILAIPVELYELNVQPGRATRFLASWSITINTCFAQTQRYFPQKKCIKTSYPIRFFGTHRQMNKTDALEKLNLSPHRKTITVLGGSQGSIEINNLIHTFILERPDLHDQIQIVHQTGNTDSFNWQRFYEQYNIPGHVINFCSDLAPHYTAADLIICRSGAGTLHEVLFFGKPCITVPLITPTNDHQLYNARAMQEEYPELFTTCVQRNSINFKKEFTHTICTELSR